MNEQTSDRELIPHTLWVSEIGFPISEFQIQDFRYIGKNILRFPIYFRYFSDIFGKFSDTVSSFTWSNFGENQCQCFSCYTQVRHELTKLMFSSFSVVHHSRSSMQSYLGRNPALVHSVTLYTLMQHEWIIKWFSISQLSSINNKQIRRIHFSSSFDAGIIC